MERLDEHQRAPTARTANRDRRQSRTSAFTAAAIRRTGSSVISAHNGAWLHARCEERIPSRPHGGRGRSVERAGDRAASQLRRSRHRSDGTLQRRFRRLRCRAPAAADVGSSRLSNGRATATRAAKTPAPPPDQRPPSTSTRTPPAGCTCASCAPTGKSFPTYHWSGGEWVSGWPKEVVPYRLPELLAAPADAIVLVCEGEKDADTAARYGFVATTNPGGAGKWQPELTQYFQGKQRVCVMRGQRRCRRQAYGDGAQGAARAWCRRSA